MSLPETLTPSEKAANQACARLDNLNHALQWVATNLRTDLAYREAFQAVVELLAERRHTARGYSATKAHSQVHLSAIGKSGDVARLLVSMLTSVGIRASFLHPTEALHGDLGLVGPDDAVIFFSYRGESSELLELAPLIKQRCDVSVAVTAFSEAPLATLADRVLRLPIVKEMSAHDHAPITSTVVTLALGQLLVAATMDDDRLDLESYALNHPGGAIGKRIFVKVDDLMSPPGSLPLVAPDATFQEVVSVMTERALGVAIVVSNNTLAGIITEKDLREAMKAHGPKIFAALAAEYMNRTPLTTSPGTLAADALRFMESRPRPLNLLPVVTPDGRISGLIRLHDLMRAGIRI